MTPLHISLQAFDDGMNNHTPQIERILLKEQADLNSQDNLYRTPIFYLFTKEIVKGTDPINMTALILQHYKVQNINHRDINGDSVLHLACKIGSTISALTLINAGADINALNNQNQNPFNVALVNNKFDLCIFMI